jgi:hypothetical protein
MTPRTRFLCSLIGFYFVLVSLCMLARREATVEIVEALIHNAPLMLMAGVIAVAVGLALVLSHNVWSGGAATIIVTLVGWAALGKGLLILLLPPNGAAEFFLETMRFVEFFYLYTGATLVIGIFLAYRGMREPGPR